MKSDSFRDYSPSRCFGLPESNSPSRLRRVSRKTLLRRAAATQTSKGLTRGVAPWILCNQTLTQSCRAWPRLHFTPAEWRADMRAAGVAVVWFNPSHGSRRVAITFDNFAWRTSMTSRSHPTIEIVSYSISMTWLTIQISNCSSRSFQRALNAFIHLRFLAESGTSTMIKPCVSR